MVARQFIALSCLFAVCSCTSAPPASSGDRCGPTPHRLVSASTFSVPPANAVSPVVIAGPLVANASELYYVISIGADNPPSVSPYLAGSVRRVPLAGGQPTEIASGYQFTKPTFTATSVILGELNAYPNSDDDAIVSVPLAGGGPTSIVSLPGGGLGDVLLGNPVSDGSYVYFEDSYGIEAVSLTGGPGGAAKALLNSLGSQGDLAIFGQQLVFL